MGETIGAEADPAMLRAIAETAQRNALGQWRSCHPAGPASWGAVKFTTGLTVAGLILTVVCAVTNAHSGTRNWAGFFGMWSFLFLLMALGAWAAAHRHARSIAGGRLDLYEHGLVAAFPDRVLGFRYDTLTVLQNITRHYHNGVEQGTTYRYTLGAPDGSTATIDQSFADPAEWGPVIQQATTAAQLPKAIARLQAGERLEFADLWITTAEIGTATDSAPWSKVEKLTMNKGFLRVYLANRGLLSLRARPIGKIPNFFVFHTLFELLRKANTATGD